ncbi:glutamate-rich protein 6 isoform X2 [Anguilla anguilla]|uniref:glutamate-rich protein 6 isoform X2 n=1 Tax=Anguilla anguilla TaxID=7936 RepID=UPI0015AA0C09|nr:glutamate-rich protein 6 isoform X2 [Anguilla anguilla]
MEEEAGIPQSRESGAHGDDVTAEASAGEQRETPTAAGTDSLPTCSDKKQREICCSSVINHVSDGAQLPQLGMPAVLRFRQESQDRATDAPRVPPQLLGDAHALCEFCGQPARPFPGVADLSIVAAEPERFCCPEAQNLVEVLAQEWRLLLQTLGQGKEVVPNPPYAPTKEEELNFKAWENEEHRQQERDMEQYFQATHPTIVPSDSCTRTISFQLSSCMPREADTSAPQDSGNVEDLDHEEGDFLTGPGVFGFGIAHHKNVGFREKYYGNGNKFLTVFPDGSAQVFYPSGRLALLITAGDGKAEMVCVVQDDHAPNPPIRALFQSNGRATCYHGNGNVWVSMDVSGGQCSDERGARVRRWRWSGHLDTPTALRPLFLSLNQSVGVRVLGQDRMFVTFLTKGCQARFSVGTGVQLKDASTTAPPNGQSISREEVFLLAGRVRLHRTLGLLHHCLRLPSNPRPPATRLPPSLVSLAKALLELSQRLQMEERDRAFIRACLQDCL